jgi:RNA polymerase sigma factor (sigma-70 family)
MRETSGKRITEKAAKSLMERLRDGDHDAWGRLVKQYSGRLERLAGKMDPLSRRREGPEEIVNSVFKSLCRRLTQTDAPGVDDLSLFLKGMVVKKLHERRTRNTAQKRDAQREIYDPGMVDQLFSKKSTPSVIVQLREEFCRILDALTAVEQAVFELALDGHSTREIAGILDYSQRSVQLYKRRIQRKAEELGYERPRRVSPHRASSGRSAF